MFVWEQRIRPLNDTLSCVPASYTMYMRDLLAIAKFLVIFCRVLYKIVEYPDHQPLPGCIVGIKK